MLALLCASCCSITFLDLNNEAAQAGILVPDITTPLVRRLPWAV